MMAVSTVGDWVLPSHGLDKRKILESFRDTEDARDDPAEHVADPGFRQALADAVLEVTDRDAELVADAERLVLPGVGHFAATRRLDETGMTPAVRAAIARGIPFLGICVGMQWLYAGSSEAPAQAGLGHFSELCARFPECDQKVPHVGWNSLNARKDSRLLAGVESGEFVYFTHSYRAPVTDDTAAQAHYIEPFAASVERRNVMGVQFHPEKSGTYQVARGLFL